MTSTIKTYAVVAIFSLTAMLSNCNQVPKYSVSDGDNWKGCLLSGFHQIKDGSITEPVTWMYHNVERATTSIVYNTAVNYASESNAVFDEVIIKPEYKRILQSIITRGKDITMTPGLTLDMSAGGSANPTQEILRMKGYFYYGGDNFTVTLHATGDGTQVIFNGWFIRCIGASCGAHGLPQSSYTTHYTILTDLYVNPRSDSGNAYNLAITEYAVHGVAFDCNRIDQYTISEETRRIDRNFFRYNVSSLSPVNTTHMFSDNNQTTCLSPSADDLMSIDINITVNSSNSNAFSFYVALKAPDDCSKYEVFYGIGCTNQCVYSFCNFLKKYDNTTGMVLCEYKCNPARHVIVRRVHPIYEGYLNKTIGICELSAIVR